MTNSNGPPTGADMPTTVVLEHFARRGWDEDHLALEDGQVRCGACRTVSEASSVEIEAHHRVEGASDPDSMVYIIGFPCPTCGRRGTIVCAFGPMASERDQRLVQALGDDHAAIDPVEADPD